MAHSENIISSIKLPDGNTYEVHDAHAIHSAEELGLGAVMRFCGTVETYDDLQALTDTQDGDVWHVTADGKEYVRCDSNTIWEFLGSVHDASSSDHTHNVTVTGTNSASAVTGSVVVPTVTSTKKYIYADQPTPSLTTDKVLGTGTTFSVSGGSATTTKLKATASGVAVAGDGTASAITALGTPTTASVIQSQSKTSILAVNSNDSVTIPNVTGNTSVTASKVSVTAGTAPSWSASVSGGVLSFNFTAGTTPSTVTATDVTASKVTLGTELTASKITTASKSVVTGGTSANVISALGTPTTEDVLTGVKVTAQPSVKLASGTSGDVAVATGVSAISVSAGANDTVDAVTDVTLSRVNLNFASTEYDGSQAIVSDVTTGTATVALQNGTAAAQTWTQKSGTTGTPK